MGSVWVEVSCNCKRVDMNYLDQWTPGFDGESEDMLADESGINQRLYGAKFLGLR